MFDFDANDSALDCVARDSLPETSYSPATVDEALAIAYGFNSSPPSQHHLLALIEHYGIHSNQVAAEVAHNLEAPF